MTDHISGPALRTYRQIVLDWRLSESDARFLISCPSPLTYREWISRAYAREPIRIPRAPLGRLAIVIQIRVGMRAAHIAPGDQAAWLRTPHTDLGRRRPLEVMTQDAQGLERVRDLVGWRAGVVV